MKGHVLLFETTNKAVLCQLHAGNACYIRQNRFISFDHLLADALS